MKKILVLLLMFYTYQATAADFTDTLGAECGRILFALNEYDYPKMFDAINKRNEQLNYLEKCIKLYKENNGTIENINKRYYRAYLLYGMDMANCYAEKNTKKSDECKSVAQYTFNTNLTLSSYELSNKYSFIYDNIDESKKETNLYQRAKEAKELTQQWYEQDVAQLEQMIEHMTEQNDKEEPKKGLFDWFK